MNRITDINSIDFPVRLDSVFIRNSKKRKYKEAIGFKAVTGKTDGREKIFSLVTDNYSLITNKQALELGRKIFREYFSKESEINLSVFNVTFPETRSFCNIDLMNNLYSFNVWEKEVYIPFMRITNSYNRTKALKFEIGFSRKWCDNGVIFEKETVSLNYIHYKKPVSEIMKDFKKYSIKRLVNKINRDGSVLQKRAIRVCKNLDLLNKPEFADELKSFFYLFIQFSRMYHNCKCRK